jgi:hypothetical protein
MIPMGEADAHAAMQTFRGRAQRLIAVGEKDTPTVAGRLAELPVSTIPPAADGFNPAQNMAYDTSRIRNELGYAEPVEYQEGLRRTLIGFHR